MTAPSLAAVFRPAATRAAWTYDLTLIALGSLLIAAAAWIQIRLPFTPVPITAQTFAVVLLGALYGSRRGAATVLAYLAQGALGLPVFAGGAAGLAYILGPTGGYLLGFILAAAVAGFLAERGWDRRPATTALAMTLATAALFIPGLLWLGLFIGYHAVLPAGLIPFLPGAIIKIALATAALPIGWKVLNHLRS